MSFPGVLAWLGEKYWLYYCSDYCAYLGTVGAKELNEKDITEEDFVRYEQKDEYRIEDARAYLVKDGSLCGYAFSVCIAIATIYGWMQTK